MVCHRLAGQQRDRNQHAELRLVGEAADQHAGKPRSAVEPVQRAAEQRRGEESVLAVADIDECGREGGGDQQRLGARQDRAHGCEISGEARHQPDGQAPGIGNRGDQRMPPRRRTADSASRRTARRGRRKSPSRPHAGAPVHRPPPAGPARSGRPRHRRWKSRCRAGLPLRSIRPSETAIQPATATPQRASRIRL